MMSERITLALPSKGAIAEPSSKFLQDCGLRVDKPNPRQYTGSMPALPWVDVLFQRVTDVAYKVSDGTAQLGVTGLDVVREHPHEDLVVVHEDLGYGACKLLVAVPEACRRWTRSLRPQSWQERFRSALHRAAQEPPRASRGVREFQSSVREESAAWVWWDGERRDFPAPDARCSKHRESLR